MARTEPTPYRKDGRIVLVNCGGEIEPRKEGGPEFAPLRNTDGRVYLPDGEAFEVIVRAGATDHVVASGTAAAAAGRLCSIWVRVRGEADVPEPPAPVIEPAEVI